ncbi:hypothetical protein HHI36_013874, partial [Cryptolaemus montrouzieri]
SITRRKNSIHGGFLILAREGIICQKLETVNELSIEKHAEIVAICDTVTNILVIYIYRSPLGDLRVHRATGQSYKSNSSKDEEQCRILVMGDLNEPVQSKTSRPTRGQDYSWIVWIRKVFRDLDSLDKENGYFFTNDANRVILLTSNPGTIL